MTLQTAQLTLNEQQRKHQKLTLRKYRDLSVIPDIEVLASQTNVDVSTTALFLSGNSTDPALRRIVRLHTNHHYGNNEMPEDLQRLFLSWTPTS